MKLKLSILLFFIFTIGMSGFSQSKQVKEIIKQLPLGEAIFKRLDTHNPT